MERTTVYLDKALKRLLKKSAKSRGITEAELIRAALARELAATRTGAPQVVGHSSDGGVARRLDDVLEESGFGLGSRDPG